MKYLFSLAGLLTFVAIPSSTFAGCSEHDYKTECEDDSKCKWESKKSKCRPKEASTGCSSHESEFYCEANRCQWDIMRKGKKCIERTGSSPLATDRAPFFSAVPRRYSPDVRFRGIVVLTGWPAQDRRPTS